MRRANTSRSGRHRESRSRAVLFVAACSCCWRPRRRRRRSASSATGPAATTRISRTACRARSRATSAACRSTTPRGCSATAGTWRATRCSSTSARPTRCPTSSSGRTSSASGRTQHPDTQELVAIEMYIGTFQQRRTIWMDGRPHPPEYAPHTFMGFSTGEWNGDILTITTTHLKAGLLPPRRHADQRSHDAWSSTGCGTATCCRR